MKQHAHIARHWKPVCGADLGSYSTWQYKVSDTTNGFPICGKCWASLDAKWQMRYVNEAFAELHAIHSNDDYLERLKRTLHFRATENDRDAAHTP